MAHCGSAKVKNIKGHAVTLRVFIVDDSAELLQAVYETLSDLALARCVGSAMSERDAAAWLDAPTEPWDVLVIEPRLQQGNGLALLERCRQRAPHQKVLILTHYATDQMRQYCLSQGADAVFDKNVQLVAFLQQLKQLQVLQTERR
jgi:DNA-binding NarL/FixJ family response regulator